MQCQKLEMTWLTQESFFRHTWDTTPLSLSLGRDKIAVGLNDGSVGIWSISDGHWAETTTCHAHDKGVRALLWCEGMLITGSYDHLIRLWSVTDKLALLQTVQIHSDGVWDLQCDKFGVSKWIVSAGLDGGIGAMRMNTNELEVVTKWSVDNEEFTCVQLSSRLDLVATGGDSGKLYLWKMSTAGMDKRILKHRGGVSGVQFLPWQSVCHFAQASLLLTADHYGKLRLWNLENDTCLAQVLGHRDAIRSLDCSYTRYLYIENAYNLNS